MSVSMFAIFCTGSALVLALIIIFREQLIDFEDSIFNYIKGMIRKWLRKS